MNLGQECGLSENGARRLKLLLIAAGCGSKAIGESWIAFQWVSRLGQRHDVTLLTYRRSDGAPTDLELPGVRVVEWPDISLFERWERFNAMLKPGYALFYARARRWLKKYLRFGGKFDVIHQIMPNALRYPCPAVDLGLPVVIGPKGGSLDTPKEFSSDFGKVPWYTNLRKIDGWRLRHDPLLRRTYASADAIIAVAPYVKDLLADLTPPSTDVEFMTETGVTHLPPPRTSVQQAGPHRLRLLFVGRVIRSKGVRDAIRALASIPDIPGLTLDVVGVGEDMESCKREARELGVGELVRFHGWKSPAEVDSFYHNSDVFVFPSFREPSGIAVVEAMSHGLALIVAERGGPGFVVDDSCGFRIPVINPEQYASDIAQCIRKFVREPWLVDAMGTAAREKIKRDFLWSTKMERMTELYSRLVTKYENRRRPSSESSNLPSSNTVVTDQVSVV
jgi:glycosyltransferase involved in cell wall biosynthesis